MLKFKSEELASFKTWTEAADVACQAIRMSDGDYAFAVDNWRGEEFTPYIVEKFSGDGELDAWGVLEDEDGYYWPSWHKDRKPVCHAIAQELPTQVHFVIDGELQGFMFDIDKLAIKSTDFELSDEQVCEINELYAGQWAITKNADLSHPFDMLEINYEFSRKIAQVLGLGNIEDEAIVFDQEVQLGYCLTY